jgi:hypothetical protein
VTCPHCDDAAAHHDDPKRTLVSLFGPIRDERAYYYCRGCGTGQIPFDTQVGIPDHNITPAVERGVIVASGPLLGLADLPGR